MSNLIQYAYVSGEISPTLYSRTDLEKYDLGLALARDWIVDYKGGIVTRPGSVYKEWQQFPENIIRWFPFEFSPQIANTNFIIFGYGYIRFTQGGNYVLEAEKIVSNVVNGYVTINAHGFSTGDLARFTDLVGPTTFSGQLFELEVINADVFRLKNLFGEYVTDPAVFVTGKFARVYTLVNPYENEDLLDLNAEQIRDTLRLTHYKYKTRDLQRLDQANWTLTETEFSSQVQSPASLFGTESASGTAGVVYTVTTVDHNGAESLPSLYLVEDSTVNFTVTEGNYKVSWTPVPGAAYYNVYRSTVSSQGNRSTRSQQLGFLGRAYGTVFLDTNIIPDFTRMPPQHNNPFADGAILWIDVSTPGTGYNQSSILNISDATGSGFQGFPIVNDDGSVAGVLVLNGGKNYSAPTITATGGTGATFSAHIGPVGQNYPAVSAVFQQRQVYAGTLASPLGIWGSRPKRFNNFDISPIVIDSDSYEFEVDAPKVSMIRHLFPMRGGLLIMNDIGVWQLSGGNQVAVTATNALAEPQSYTGISNLTPLKIETDISYVEPKGYTVRLLSYNDLAKIYAGTDISILSAHFFGRGKEIVSWTYAQEPFKLIHAVREDGYRLLGTVIRDQNVFAWTLASTKGYYKQVLSLREDRFDRVYLDVVRIIKGKTVRFIELEAQRDFATIEDAWCVDCGLTRQTTSPFATLIFSALSGDAVSVTASNPIFIPAHVDQIIYAGGGKARVIEYISPTEIVCKILKPISALTPQSEDEPAPVTYGNWTIDAPIKTFTGLWHLEGQEVAILGDGNVFPRQTVVNGSVTLSAGVVKVKIGLPFRAVAQTLPPTASQLAIEAKRKRVNGVALRINNSRGLKAGSRLDQLYELKERTTENYGQAINRQTGLRYTTVDANWDYNGQTYFVVDDPLPVTILGHTLDLEVGDDSQ